ALSSTPEVLRAAQPAATETARSAVSIAEAWTVETSLRSENAPIYLRITNAGDTEDQLIGADSEMAESMQLQDAADGAAPKVAERIVLAPGTTSLEPGKSRLMLVGLRQTLNEGDSFIITVKFAKASQQSTVVRILSAKSGGVASVRPRLIRKIADRQ